LCDAQLHGARLVGFQVSHVEISGLKRVNCAGLVYSGRLHLIELDEFDEILTLTYDMRLHQGVYLAF